MRNIYISGMSLRGTCFYKAGSVEDINFIQNTNTMKTSIKLKISNVFVKGFSTIFLFSPKLELPIGSKVLICGYVNAGFLAARRIILLNDEEWQTILDFSGEPSMILIQSSSWGR